MAFFVPKFFRIFTNRIFQRKSKAEQLRTSPEEEKTLKNLEFRKTYKERRTLDAVEKPVSVLGDRGGIVNRGVMLRTETNTAGVQEEKFERAKVPNGATRDVNNKSSGSCKHASENISLTDLINTVENLSKRIPNLEGFKVKMDAMEKQIIRLNDECKGKTPLNNWHKNTATPNSDIVNRIISVEASYKFVSSSNNKLIEKYDKLNSKVDYLGNALNIKVGQNVNDFFYDDAGYEGNTTAVSDRGEFASKLSAEDSEEYLKWLNEHFDSEFVPQYKMRNVAETTATHRRPTVFSRFLRWAMKRLRTICRRRPRLSPPLKYSWETGNPVLKTRSRR